MEFPYEADNKGEFRPIVGVHFQSDGVVFPLPIKCLLDTGSARTMLQWEIADAFGIDLKVADDYGQDVLVGGKRRKGTKVVTMSLQVHSLDDLQVLHIPDVSVLFVKGDLPVPGLLGSTALKSTVTVFREYEGIVNIRPPDDFCAPGCPHYNGSHPL